MVVDWVVVVVIYKDEDEMNPVVAWVVVISKADGYEERESKLWLGGLGLSLEAQGELQKVVILRTRFLQVFPKYFPINPPSSSKIWKGYIIGLLLSYFLISMIPSSSPSLQ